MTFQAGKSGNPRGRPKGALGRRIQLVKLLEPRAEELVAKMIELALSGDSIAMRLCIERLIPKMQHEPTGIELPVKLTPSKVPRLKEDILRAAFDGHMSIGDAERFTRLINELNGKVSHLNTINLADCDPIEAAKIYQRVMSG